MDNQQNNTNALRNMNQQLNSSLGVGISNGGNSGGGAFTTTVPYIDYGSISTQRAWYPSAGRLYELALTDGSRVIARMEPSEGVRMVREVTEDDGSRHTVLRYVDSMTLAELEVDVASNLRTLMEVLGLEYVSWSKVCMELSVKYGEETDRSTT